MLTVGIRCHSGDSEDVFDPDIEQNFGVSDGCEENELLNEPLAGDDSLMDLSSTTCTESVSIHTVFNMYFLLERFELQSLTIYWDNIALTRITAYYIILWHNYFSLPHPTRFKVAFRSKYVCFSTSKIFMLPTFKPWLIVIYEHNKPKQN